MKSSDDLRDFSRNLPMALLRAREAVMARFRPILRAHGLSEQQWRVLRVLADEDGLEISALAERTLLLMPSLTRILKGMEEAALVAREGVAGDKRRRVMRLTDAGRERFAVIAPLSEGEYRGIEEAVGAEELERLYGLLGKLGE